MSTETTEKLRTTAEIISMICALGFAVTRNKFENEYPEPVVITGRNGKRVDFQGDCVINGKKLRIAAWIKQGNRGQFFSLSFSEPRPQQPPSAPMPAPRPAIPPRMPAKTEPPMKLASPSDDDSEVPF